MAIFRIDVVQTAEELQEVLAIRMRVFVEEQHVPSAEETDRFDTDSDARAHVVYVLGRLEGTPVATGRLLLDADTGGAPHIERVAVLAPHRARGYGTAIMEALHAEARSRGFDGATLAAQVQAIPFYVGLGYIAHGPLFLDAGIEHRQMDLRFPN